jgi:hypothetical protein
MKVNYAFDKKFLRLKIDLQTNYIPVKLVGNLL